MSSQEQSDVSSNWANMWSLSVALLCLGLLGYIAFYSTNTARNPAVLAGECLSEAAVVWFIVWVLSYAIFGGSRGAKNIVVYCAIYASLFLGGLINASLNKQQAIKAVSSVQEEFARVTAVAMTTGGQPREVVLPQAAAPVAKGEFGEVEKFMKVFMAELVSQRNDYQKEFEAIGWNSILDLHRIEEDANLSESRMIISKARMIVKSYKLKTDDLMGGVKKNIDNLAISSRLKDEIIYGFDHNIVRARKQIDAVWCCEESKIKGFENIIELLATSKNWSVKGGKMLFQSEADLARFNSYVSAIRETAKQQQLTQREGQARVNDNFNSIKNNGY